MVGADDIWGGAILTDCCDTESADAIDGKAACRLTVRSSRRILALAAADAVAAKALVDTSGAFVAGERLASCQSYIGNCSALAIVTSWRKQEDRYDQLDRWHIRAEVTTYELYLRVILLQNKCSTDSWARKMNSNRSGNRHRSTGQVRCSRRICLSRERSPEDRNGSERHWDTSRLDSWRRQRLDHQGKRLRRIGGTDHPLVLRCNQDWSDMQRRFCLALRSLGRR